MISEFGVQVYILQKFREWKEQLRQSKGLMKKIDPGISKYVFAERRIRPNKESNME